MGWNKHRNEVGGNELPSHASSSLSGTTVTLSTSGLAENEEGDILNSITKQNQGNYFLSALDCKPLYSEEKRGNNETRSDKQKCYI